MCELNETLILTLSKWCTDLL